MPMLNWTGRLLGSGQPVYPLFQQIELRTSIFGMHLFLQIAMYCIIATQCYNIKYHVYVVVDEVFAGRLG